MEGHSISDHYPTESLCPICLKRISAQRIIRDGAVYLQKKCLDHGEFSTVIWRGVPTYDEWGKGEDALGPQNGIKPSSLGCPYDCGLCSEHQAQTCTVLMEVTSRCNLRCPVCFAEADAQSTSDPDLEEIHSMLQADIDSGGPHPLQLSGGEPTVRDDLPDIINMAKAMGFPHVQVNTNGVRLAEDPHYALTLKDAGLDLVYLQFDGVSDSVYQKLRGAPLFNNKVTAIEYCSKVKLAVQFVPTLIPGINTQEIGEIIQFAKKWIPVVKGVHFQPISYFGRYPTAPSDNERITLPEVLNLIEVQTGGEIKMKNFLPRRRSNSHCGFSGFFVLDADNTLQPLSVFNPEEVNATSCEDQIQGRPNPSVHFRQFVQQRSVYVEPCSCCSSKKSTSQDRFTERSHTHYLSISGMPFQDVWTVELERLQGCCIHVISPVTKQLIPFCAYYLTAANGERLKK